MNISKYLLKLPTIGNEQITHTTYKVFKSTFTGDRKPLSAKTLSQLLLALQACMPKLDDTKLATAYIQLLSEGYMELYTFVINKI